MGGIVLIKKSTEPCHCEGSSVLYNEKVNFAAGTEAAKKELLLHSCCGPCSTAVIERLAPDYNITVFYYNPCITEADEYERRKENQIRFIDEYNKKMENEYTIRYLEGRYDPERYFELVDGYEEEPEGGARCTICFEMRLLESARVAKEKGYPAFTTTLTVSPHKNYPLISQIGRDVAEKYHVEFLDLDFKKKAGFQRSIQLSKEYELYRQNYCGCIFSKR